MNLLENPFRLLGVSTRDASNRIVLAAEEKSLVLNAPDCTKARMCLTNPRKRLSAEIAWLPGLSPGRAGDLIEKLVSAPTEVTKALPSLAPLSQCNIAVSLLRRIDFAVDHDLLGDWLRFICNADERIEPESIMRAVNEDRTVAKMPLVQNIDDVEEELSARRKYFLSSMFDLLKKVENPDICLTKIIRESLKLGHLPAILEELADQYQIEVTKYLDQLEKRMDLQIDTAKKYAQVGQGTSKSVKAPIDDLIALLRSWDQIIEPIHLVAKNRGIEDGRSFLTARKIRDFAVHLANTYALHEDAKRITESMGEVFEEISQLSERIEEDKSALTEILQKKTQSKQHEDEWAKEIYLNIEFGTFFKDRLYIGPDGIRHNDAGFPLDKITRIRWGAFVNYTNGIRTHTSYLVSFGTNERMINVECSVKLESDAASKERFSTVINKLWRAVGIRLINETLSLLSKGYNIRYGDIVVDKDGITLQKKKFFSSEPYYAKWEELKIGSGSGKFVIMSEKEKKAAAELSYRDMDNVHVLESVMEFLWKDGNFQKLRRGEFS